MTNNQRWIRRDVVLLLIFLFAIQGKTKSDSFEIDRKDYEYLLDRAKKFESVRTNAPVVSQSNDIIYISIANILKYEIKVQRSQPNYPTIHIGGGLALTPSLPIIRAPFEIGLKVLPNIYTYFRADALGFITTNFGFEVGVKLVYP